MVNLVDDESDEESPKVPSKVVMPSVITSRLANLVASKNIRDSPERRTPLVHSSVFGTDKEVPSEEAKLP
jgi:hypothetical protein